MNKMTNYTICPDDNELAMFIEGKLTGERLLFVKKHLNSCPHCNEAVQMAMELNAMEEELVLEEEEFVQRHAARTSRNLCVIHAEQYILQLHGYEVPVEELKEIAILNKWLKKKGVKFKNIGKLLEHFQLEVERKSKSSLADIQKALDSGYPVLVGVDKGELLARTRIRKVKEKVEDWIDQRPDHVLIVKEISQTEGTVGTIVLLNIENERHEVYSLSAGKFMEAWEDSEYYLVIVKQKIL